MQIKNYLDYLKNRLSDIQTKLRNSKMYIRPIERMNRKK